MKRRMFLAIGSYEAGVLWKFLDGVSAAVSSRMVGGSSPGEENLTFLLCELLDANTTSLHALSYPLTEARSDLETSDAGLTVDVEFETHDHTKYFESKYSGADLGIVLAVNHPIWGKSRRGILVQAKRLFCTAKSREYSLDSRYNSFDIAQAEFLKALSARFAVYNSIFYLWYNPASTAFREQDAKVLRAYDAGSGPYQGWPRMHPFLDELLQMGLPWPFVGGHARLEPSADKEEKSRQWRQTQPALRFSALDTVLSVANYGVPQLKALYDATLEHHSYLAFSPFADFLLLALACERYGSDNPDWLRLTEGQRVALPANRQGNTSGDDLAGLDSPPIPRHTLRVTIRSTLPQVG